MRAPCATPGAPDRTDPVARIVEGRSSLSVRTPSAQTVAIRMFVGMHWCEVSGGGDDEADSDIEGHPRYEELSDAFQRLEEDIAAVVDERDRLLDRVAQLEDQLGRAVD